MADNYELKTAEIKITKDVLTSQTFDSGDAVALMVEKVSGAVTAMAVYAAETESGQYYRLADTAMIPVVEKRRYHIEGCYPYRWLRFVGDADGVIRVYSKHDAPISTLLKGFKDWEKGK